MRRDLEMEPPDCASCDRPTLSTANVPEWQLFWKAAPLARDGYGKVHLDNFRLAAAARDLDWDEVLLDKLTLLIQVFLQKSDD